MVFIRDYEITTRSSSKKTTLRIGQEFSGEEGVVVWDAALVLAKYLESFSNKLPWSKGLELGAGTGFLGILAGVALGIDILVTDVSKIRPLIDQNVKENAFALEESVKVIPFTLDWDSPPPLSSLPITPFDLILISDGIYYESGVEPLLSVLQLYSSPKTDIFISYEIRPDKEDIVEKFFKGAAEAKLSVERILEDLDPRFSSDDILVFKLKKQE